MNKFIFKLLSKKIRFKIFYNRTWPSFACQVIVLVRTTTFINIFHPPLHGSTQRSFPVWLTVQKRSWDSGYGHSFYVLTSVINIHKCELYFKVFSRFLIFCDKTLFCNNKLSLKFSSHLFISWPSDVFLFG